MGRSAVEQGMNDFISGFKLKGSSSLELKTDLCMLWNEESNHSVHRPYYSGCYCKTKEAKNYSDDKNVIQCGGRKCLHTIRTLKKTQKPSTFTILNLTNASYTL